MKFLFILTLVIAITYPFYEEVRGIRQLAHNQSASRPRQLAQTEVPKFPSAHLGLTEGQLAGVDQLVADAYRESVRDGANLNRDDNNLRLDVFCLGALLFVCSLAGLRACRRPPNPSSEPPLPSRR